MGVADLTTQSPPLAITLGEMIGANDPKATALNKKPLRPLIYCH
jgi:hypothetical protein